MQLELDLQSLRSQCRRLRMACEADVPQPPAFWTALGREILATFLSGQRLLVQVQASMIVAATTADSATYVDRREAATEIQLVLEQLSNLRLIAERAAVADPDVRRVPHAVTRSGRRIAAAP